MKDRLTRERDAGGRARRATYFCGWNVGRAKMQSSGSMHRAMADVSVAVSFLLDHRRDVVMNRVLQDKEYLIQERATKLRSKSFSRRRKQHCN